MNITEYVSNDGSVQIYNGKMSLRREYHIVNADESIYKYIGSNSVLPITTLIHKEDLQCFYNAVAALDNGPQHLIVRFMDCNDTYRYMYMIMSYNGKILDDFRSIDVELLDIVHIHNRYNRLKESVNKYRILMSLSNNIYIEYFYDEKLVNVFEYANWRGVERFRKNIDEMMAQIEDSSEYSYRQKTEFAAFYDCLTAGTTRINLSMDGVLFGLGCRLNVSGGILSKNGRRYMMVSVATPVKNEDRESQGKYYMTEYGIDAATGVYNKRAISELAMDIIAEAGDKTLYIIMMDVDDFKTLNDTYGHMVGDKILTRVAEIIKEVLGNRGYVGRFGGDEFFIVTDKIKSDEDIILMLKTIRKQIAWNCRQEVNDFNVTTSLGISRYPYDGKSYDELFKIADKCLYIAKAKGRDRYILYDLKLHGAVDNGDSSGYMNVAAWNNSYQMCGVSYNIISDIYKGGFGRLQESLESVRSSFDIDGIAVYQGADYKRICQSGEYLKPICNAVFINEKGFAGCFDEFGVYGANKVLEIREVCPKGYKLLTEQSNSAFLLVKFNTDMGPMAVSYDIFNRLRKWSDHEKGLLMMIAKAVMEVVADRDI